MKNKLRLVSRVLVWAIAIFITIWALLWGYVIINKKSLIAKVNTELTSKVKGEIQIGDIEPSLLSTFPNVSIRLSDVYVRDTMWKQHHHDLLKAERVFIRLKLFSLFSGSPEISKVIVEKGAVFIFSDTLGYSNEYMFQSRQTGESSNTANQSPVPDIDLNNVHLVVDLKDRDKLFDFEIDKLKCDIKTTGNLLNLDVKTKMLAHSLAFNTGKGGFVKERPIEGKFRLHFDRMQKKLTFKNVRLQIDDHPFDLTGMFDFSGVPPLYYLAIKTKNVIYKRAALLLSDNISRRLDSFNIEKPIEVTAIIDGSTLPNKMPLINIEAKIEHNNLSAPIGNFTDASLVGKFTNRINASEGNSDKNSGFRFTGGSAKWENIRLTCDTLSIVNLVHPIMDCDLHSTFELSELNEVMGTSTIEFTKGQCMANLTYHGAIMKADTAAASIMGTVNLKNASIKYIPRNLVFDNCSGNLVFHDKDFYVKQLKAHTGNSDLTMNGAVKNLTSLIDKSPEKLVLDWNISSPKIVLGDFISFLDKRTSIASSKKSAKKMLKISNQVDKMLNDCNVNLQLNADRLIYKKFTAEKVAANLQLTDKILSIKDVSVEHAGGTLTLNGSLSEVLGKNVIQLNSNMTNVDVTKVFTAFNNFGQDGITDKNLRGRLSANVAITGTISNKAEIEQNSLKGVVNLNLKDGELIDFEPIKKISQTAFKNRDFSNIQFAELIEKLEINGSEIKVNRMEIQSTVLTMFVEGIYDVKKGTDMSIQIPLSNLAKRGEDFELKNKGTQSKTGMSLRLRAQTGEDGKAKISWDPFRVSLKSKDKITQPDEPADEPTKTKRRRRR